MRTRCIISTRLAASLFVLAACDDTSSEVDASETSTETETSGGQSTSTSGPDETETETGTGEPDLPPQDETETSETETSTETETGAQTETGEPECAQACEEGSMCVEGECVPVVCGDGIASAPEECDDGNDVELDGCESDCTFSPGAVQIAGGLYVSCALQFNGDVVCWGRNEFGQLGQGHTEDIGNDELPNVLGAIDIGGPASSISATREHVCAVREDQQLVCWGTSAFGRLGYGDLNIVGNNELPVEVGTVDVGAPVRRVYAGNSTTCALTVDDELVCWGNNTYGGLGYANTIRIGDDESAGSYGTVDVGGPVLDVAMLAQHVCALLDDGTVRCWGLDTPSLGQGAPVGEPLGDDESPASIPTLDLGGPAQALAGGFDHVCALLDSGDVVCWGNSNAGQLGYGDYANVGDDETPASVGPVNLGEPAVAIAAGTRRTCAIGESGSLYCWGDNGSGELGYPDVVEAIGGQLVPAEVGPVDMPGPVDQVVTTQTHTCVMVDTQVYCWGGLGGGYAYGISEALGDDEAPTSQGPVQFLGGEGNGGIEPEPNAYDGEWDVRLTMRMPTPDPPVGLEVDTLVRIQGSYWYVFLCEGCSDSFVVRNAEDQSLIAANIGSMNYPQFAPHGGIMAMLGLEADTWLSPLDLNMSEADLCAPLEFDDCGPAGMRQLAEVYEDEVLVGSVLDSTRMQTSSSLVSAYKIEQWTNCNTVDTQTGHSVSIVPLDCAPNCEPSTVDSCEVPQSSLEFAAIGFRFGSQPVDPGYDITCRVLSQSPDGPNRWELDLDCIDIP